MHNKQNRFRSAANTLASICAAAFGVQSRKNLDQDFNRSSAVPFIVAGVLFTLVFVLALYAIVNLVVPEG